ncbi:Flp pilus assembly protein CpaB [Pandoraea morbifera]|uniref:Flp pilus assembly protein CpaB n=1 Tax=Pandoraea morbifera TaxID=2508300 RepID=A0A5E4RKJ8_9BURK|nr:Flp pilus assembly protein CpaB [Pandoraea morbifera]VVD63856.1 Flp pilus assembly protein CpaB [Pandoraea morbifera]
MMLKRIKTQALIHNPWVMLGVAVFAAALLTVWIYKYMSGREEAMRRSLMESMNSNTRVSVLVPTSDLKAGAIVTTGNFAARQVPADFVYEDTVRADEFDAVENQTLVRAVHRGSPIRRADISAMQARDFSDMLKAGTRALTIDIDATNSADNMLKPGNHIDLFLIANPPTSAPGSGNGGSGTNAQSAQLLLSDLTVLATGRDVRPRDYGEQMSRDRSEDTPSDEYGSLTLQVTPEQAGKIALAQKIGSLRAVLRNRSDKAATPDVVVHQSALFGDAGADGIQYIIGGSHDSSVSVRPELAMPGMRTPIADAAAAPRPALTPSDAQRRVMEQVQSALAGRRGQ